MRYSELSDNELFEVRENNNDDIFPDKKTEIIKEIEKRISNKLVKTPQPFQKFLVNDINCELEEHVANLYVVILLACIGFVLISVIYSNISILFEGMPFLIFLPIAFVIKKYRSISSLIVSVSMSLIYLVLMFISEGNIMFMILLSFVVYSGVTSIYKILKYRSVIKSWGI